MCVDVLGYVYVSESNVVLNECDEPQSLFVFPICTYGGALGYFWCLAFGVSFTSCIVMMSACVLCTRVFSPSI